MSKVLLVEDNKLLQKVNSYFIKELDHCSVEIAEDGYTALEKIMQHQYDLVVLDVGLPDIDGREVCRRIRKITHKKNIPIVVLTAHGYAIEQECLDAGANDFIVKPISKKALQKIIKYWLSICNR
jgi:CheY-like chemotaxis protein